MGKGFWEARVHCCDSHLCSSQSGGLTHWRGRSHSRTLREQTHTVSHSDVLDCITHEGSYLAARRITMDVEHGRSLAPPGVTAQARGAGCLGSPAVRRCPPAGCGS